VHSALLEKRSSALFLISVFFSRDALLFSTVSHRGSNARCCGLFSFSCQKSSPGMIPEGSDWSFSVFVFRPSSARNDLALTGVVRFFCRPEVAETTPPDLRSAAPPETVFLNTCGSFPSAACVLVSFLPDCVLPTSSFFLSFLPPSPPSPCLREAGKFCGSPCRTSQSNSMTP